MKRTLWGILLLLIPASPLSANVTDAPHNNEVHCGSCHTYSLWWQYSPVSASTSPPAAQLVNNVCLSCHGPAGNALEQSTHSSDVMGTTAIDWLWSRNCIDCHDPHFQSQLNWITSNAAYASDLYLVTGTIDPDSLAYDPVDNSTTFSYSNANSDKINWLAPTQWVNKSTAGRGTILVVSKENMENTYRLKSVFGNTLSLNGADGFGTFTIAGEARPEDVEGQTFGLIYGQMIRSDIAAKPVKFFSPDAPQYSFVDTSGTIPPQGVCEVCHSQTAYFTADGSAQAHFSDPCTNCHGHLAGFVHGNGISDDQSCGVSGCHETNKHLAHRDIQIQCNDCHDTTTMWNEEQTIVFKDGEPLQPTTVCVQCHWDGAQHPADPTEPSLKSNWANPLYDLGCNGCHGTTTTSGYPDYPSGLPKANSHEYHVQNKLLGCENCHYTTTTDGTTITNVNNHLNNVYNLQGGIGVSFNYASLPSEVSCQSISCHRGREAVWGDPSSVSCGSCHGASNNDPPGNSGILLDGGHMRHAKRLEDWSWNTWPRELPCTLCHYGIIDGTGPDAYSVADDINHRNSLVNWEFNTADKRLTAASSYSIDSGTAPVTDGTTPRPYGTCSNIYCHSNVQPDGGIGAPSVYDNPTWGTVKNVFGPFCQGCHNQENAYHGDAINTGSHGMHVRNYFFGLSLSYAQSVEKCTICHKWNAEAARGSCANQCHDTFEKMYHVNGDVDVLFDNFAGVNASYNGTKQPGDGYASCSNTYCHSDGTSIAAGAIPANTSADWGSSSLTCSDCHSMPPAYPSGTPKANSHDIHSTYACQTCHNSTTQDGITIFDDALHVNGSYDLAPGNGESFNYVFDPNGGTCTSISCHGNGDATWGSAAP